MGRSARRSLGDSWGEQGRGVLVGSHWRGSIVEDAPSPSGLAWLPVSRHAAGMTTPKDLAEQAGRAERFQKLKEQIGATDPHDRARWEGEASAGEHAELSDAAGRG